MPEEVPTIANPKSLNIEEVEGGFIIRRSKEVTKESKDGSEYTDFQERKGIATNQEDLVEILNDWLES